MSARTIAEFDHEMLLRLMRAPAGLVESLLMSALASGSESDWHELEHFGICRIVQCDHGDDRTVVVNRKEYPVP